VLEHLADPVAALRHWRGFLARDGVLWVAVAEVPSAGSRSIPDLGRGIAVGSDESRPDHCFSPYFLALCLRVAGFGEIVRVPATPYVRPDAPRLLTYRAAAVHPVRRLARRLLGSSRAALPDHGLGSLRA
jgi:hypothetical protein